MSEIKFTLNGKTTATNATSLKEFLISVHLNTKHIAIAVNDEIIPTANWETHNIKNGDHIEIVEAIVGG